MSERAEAPAGFTPLPFRGLLDEAMSRVRRHFRQVYLPVALPLALVSGAATLVQTRWYAAAVRAGAGGAPGLGWVSEWLLNLCLAAFGMLAYGLGAAALVAGCVDAVAGRPVSMRRAWSWALRPATVGTLLLAWLALAGGFVLCLLPGIYVYVLLSLLVPVMAEERRSGASALTRCTALISYNPRRDFLADPRLKAFAIAFAALLLGYVLGVVVQLPLLVTQQVLLFRGLAGGEPMDAQAVMARLGWLAVPSQMLATLVQMGVKLYAAFGMTLLYFDVRRRREGDDLQEAIARLAGAAPGFIPPGGQAPKDPAS